MDSLFNNILSEQFLNPIYLSLKVAIVATLFVIILGTIFGRIIGPKEFKGKSIVETLLMIPMVLPPTVVGFFLIILFGRSSVVGQMVEWIFHQPIMFTWVAAVIAAIVVSFPVMYQSAKSGFLAIDRDLEEAARMDGASEWKVFWYISIPLASKALISGGILSFARALGEFGATLMFAGNIPGKTQTLPTAIYVGIESGNMQMAWLWVISIFIISFTMLFIIQTKLK